MCEFSGASPAHDVEIRDSTVRCEASRSPLPVPQHRAAGRSQGKPVPRRVSTLSMVSQRPASLASVQAAPEGPPTWRQDEDGFCLPSAQAITFSDPHGPWQSRDPGEAWLSIELWASGVFSTSFSLMPVPTCHQPDPSQIHSY